MSTHTQKFLLLSKLTAFVGCIATLLIFVLPIELQTYFIGNLAYAGFVMFVCPILAFIGIIAAVVARAPRWGLLNFAMMIFSFFPFFLSMFLLSVGQ